MTVGVSEAFDLAIRAITSPGDEIIYHEPCYVSYATEIPGIFTAGDMHRGQSLVVWAIHEGRGCARDIDCYLMGYTEMAE